MVAIVCVNIVRFGYQSSHGMRFESACVQHRRRERCMGRGGLNDAVYLMNSVPTHVLNML